MEKGLVKHVHILKTTIAQDQKDYIEQIRLWLRDSLKSKGKIVGGPVDGLSSEQLKQYYRMLNQRFAYH